MIDGDDQLLLLKGYTGELLFRENHLPLAGDIRLWLQPGLEASGIHSEFLSLSVPVSLRLGQSVAMNFGKGIAPPNPEEISYFQVEQPFSNAPLINQTMILRRNGKNVVCSEYDTGRETCMTWENLTAHYSHLLVLRRSSKLGKKSYHRIQTCCRWAAYSTVFPEECIGSSHSETEKRLLSSKFLNFLAERKSDRNRDLLKSAADLLQNSASIEDVWEVWNMISEYCARTLGLPYIANGRLSSYSERGELTYLARAGNTFCKIYSASILKREMHQPNVAATLQQLAFDQNPWVRAIVADVNENGL